MGQFNHKSSLVLFSKQLTLSVFALYNEIFKLLKLIMNTTHSQYLMRKLTAEGNVKFIFTHSTTTRWRTSLFMYVCLHRKPFIERNEHYSFVRSEGKLALHTSLLSFSTSHRLASLLLTNVSLFLHAFFLNFSFPSITSTFT